MLDPTAETRLSAWCRLCLLAPRTRRRAPPLNPKKREHPETLSTPEAMRPFKALARALLLGAALAASSGGALSQSSAPDADPDCLTITQASTATYMISNTACLDQSVLASIELSGGAADVARCFTKKIRTQISIASETAAPVINYQCIEGAPGCSVETLHGMFPECHAG